jgi:chromosome segregation ATPase
MMKRIGKLLTVLVVVALGAWGCAQGPANSNGLAEKIQVLETKCARLEKDYRVVASDRDEARTKSASLFEENTRLQKQFNELNALFQKELDTKKLLARERDDLRLQIETRTNERNGLQTRCDNLKKGLQNLLGQDEAYLSSSQPNTNTNANAPTLGN